MGVIDTINQAGSALDQYHKQQNPGPTGPGSNVQPNASTPAAPALDMTGAGGSGPIGPAGPAAPQQQSQKDLTDSGGMPGDKAGEVTIEDVEQSVKNVANGSDKASGAIGANATDADPDVAAAKIADQKTKLNENMAAQGANPELALQQLKDKNLARLKQLEKDGAITKETHTKLKDRWKNIFNVIPKEDFGMVLMDFGMRAMMAGESMGNMGALGAAGAGALEGVERRKDQSYERGVEQEKLAGDMARADMGALTRAETAGKKGADTINTDKGIMKWNPETNAYDTPVLNPDGTPAKPSALSGRPPVDKWRIDQLVAMGFTEEKAKRFVILGQDPQRARELAFQAWQRFEGDADATITIGGKTYTKRDVRKAELSNLRDQFFEESMGVLGISAEDIGGGALPSNTGGGDSGEYQWKKDKPAGWTSGQWDTYTKQREEAVGW